MDQKPRRSVSKLNYRRPDKKKIVPVEINAPQKAPDYRQSKENTPQVVFDDLVQANSETRRDRFESRKKEFDKFLKLSVYPRIRKHVGRLISGIKNFDYKQHTWQQYTSVVVVFLLSLGVVNLTSETDKHILGIIDLQQQQIEQKTDVETGVIADTGNIDGADVVISRQELPQKYRDNPAELEGLAQSLGTNNKIQTLTTSRGIVYLVEKVGRDQIAVLAYNDQLVFITSKLYIRPNIWIDYINNLD